MKQKYWTKAVDTNLEIVIPHGYYQTSEEKAGNVFIVFLPVSGKGEVFKIRWTPTLKFINYKE
jgi:hypothetical protein